MWSWCLGRLQQSTTVMQNALLSICRVSCICFDFNLLDQSLSPHGRLHRWPLGHVGAKFGDVGKA